MFCVEVENDDMEVNWFKDGLKLHETHQTILKSFGKTQILVFVNVAYHDSGVVTFVAGRSKTSSRLKVKGTFWTATAGCVYSLNLLIKIAESDIFMFNEAALSLLVAKNLEANL